MRSIATRGASRIANTVSTIDKLVCFFHLRSLKYAIDDLLWAAIDEQYAIESEIYEVDEEIRKVKWKVFYRNLDWYKFDAEKKELKAQKEELEYENQEKLAEISFYEEVIIGLVELWNSKEYDLAGDDIIVAHHDRNTLQATLDIGYWMGPVKTIISR